MSPSWWASTLSRKQGKDLQDRHAYRSITGWLSASSAHLPLHLCLTIANTAKRKQEDSQSFCRERVCHCRVLSLELVQCEKDKSQSFKDPSCTEGFFFLSPRQTRTLRFSTSEPHPTGRKSLKRCFKSATQSHPMQSNTHGKKPTLIIHTQQWDLV